MYLLGSGRPEGLATSGEDHAAAEPDLNGAAQLPFIDIRNPSGRSFVGLAQGPL